MYYSPFSYSSLQVLLWSLVGLTSVLVFSYQMYCCGVGLFTGILSDGSSCHRHSLGPSRKFRHSGGATQRDRGPSRNTNLDTIVPGSTSIESVPCLYENTAFLVYITSKNSRYLNDILFLMRAGIALPYCHSQ